jgi:hypothetical protein
LQVAEGGAELASAAGETRVDEVFIRIVDTLCKYELPWEWSASACEEKMHRL